MAVAEKTGTGTEKETYSTFTHRIGDILVSQGFISKKHLDVALKIQKVKRKLLGEILVDLGFVSSKELAMAIAQQQGLEYVDLTTTVPSKKAISLLKRENAVKLEALCVKIHDNEVYVAIDNPMNIKKQAQIKSLLKDYKVTFVVAEREKILESIDRYYSYYFEPLEETISSLSTGAVIDSSKIVPLVDSIFKLAFFNNASDIHINPLEDVTVLSLRIDGALIPFSVFPKAVHDMLVSRIKLMARMNVSERRLPQDGAITLKMMGMDTDIRVSTLPTDYGEKVVMRILKKDYSKLNIAFLGYTPEQEQILRKASTLSAGMIVISGPTGSGKSTTLYSLLRQIDYIERNVVTVEDPIEYKFNMIYQTEVNESIGYKFSTALKYFLRQDPDVILVGEIRDSETASMAVEAANTGHLLLTTVHADSVIASVYRLFSLGGDPDILLSVLKVIASQRLIRMLCPFCKQAAPLEYVEKLEKIFPELFQLIEEPTVFVSKGCERCKRTGYIGRSVIAEVVEFDDEIVEAFMSKKGIPELKKLFREKGIMDIGRAGIYKVLKGETDIKEIVRAVGYIHPQLEELMAL